MMSEERQVILQKAKQFFKDKIVANHKKHNTQKNLILICFYKSLCNFTFVNCNSKSIAQALVYPRVLGTSINTIFGTQMQSFCKDVLI